MPDPRAGWSSWLFPLAVATRAGEAALRSFASLLEEESEAASPASAPDWATPNHVRLELRSMCLREFAEADEGAIPFLVLTPFALHGAVIADIAVGHSVMQRLLTEGIGPLFLVEWRSATADMRHLSIDSYLADLNVAIDDLGGRVNLIGLCQGGWLATMLAARFPQKVHSLVIAGAPVDLDACPSRIVDATRSTAPALFEGLIEAGDGLILGHKMRGFWHSDEHDDAGIARILQVEAPAAPELLARFNAWNDFTLDIPGVYYRETVETLFRRNELARACFRALGRTLALSSMTAPLMVLAGAEDDVVPPEQALAAASLVGTRRSQIETIVTPAQHLSLFMGARVLAGPWCDIAAWLHRHGRPRAASTRSSGERQRPARSAHA